MNTNNRIYLYDNFKFFLILLVVVGHFAEPLILQYDSLKGLFLFIYSFHMPLFLFISGHFHKNTNIPRKVFTLVVIGFASKFVFTMLPFILNGSNPTFKLLSDNGLPWYMFVLAIHTLLSYVLRDINPKVVLIFFIILACFVGYDSSISDYLYLSRTIIFYPFYLIGQMVTKEQVLKLSNSKWLRIGALVIIAACFMICLTYVDSAFSICALFTGRNPYSVNVLFTKYGFLFRLLCYVISAVMGLSVLSWSCNKQLPLVTAFGSRTLQVYFWHWPVLAVFTHFGVDELLCANGPIGKLIWLAIAVVVTIILSLKPFGFPVVQISNSINPRVK